MLKKNGNWSKLAVILVNYNGSSIIESCLESLLMQKYPYMEIVVVDNASLDSSMELVEQKYPHVHTIYSKENIGWGAGCNLGAETAIENGAEYILLLNTDTEIEESMIELLMNAVDDSCVAIPRMYTDKQDKNGSLWYSGGRIDYRTADVSQCIYSYNEDDEERNKVRRVDFATGCCMLIPASVWRHIGGFDEEYFMYYEDTDFCVRLREEHIDIVYVPEAALWHKVGGSSGGEVSYVSQYYTVRNRLFFAERFSRYMESSTMDVLREILRERTFFSSGYDRKYQRVVKAAIEDYFLGIRGRERNIIHDNYTITQGFYGIEKLEGESWQWNGDKLAEIEIANPHDERKTVCFSCFLHSDICQQVEIYIDEVLYDVVKLPEQIVVRENVNANDKIHIQFKSKEFYAENEHVRLLAFKMQGAKVEYMNCGEYLLGAGVNYKEQEGDKEYYWISNKKVGIKIYNPHYVCAVKIRLFVQRIGGEEMPFEVRMDDKVVYESRYAGIHEFTLPYSGDADMQLSIITDAEPEQLSEMDVRKAIYRMSVLGVEYIQVYEPDKGLELETIIDGYDNISFDIWDTLITRKIMEPDDVFALVEEQAGTVGIPAEGFTKIRRNAVFSVSRANPNLDEIYEVVKENMGLSHEHCEKLKNLEIETEQSLVVPRNEMVDMVRYAKSQGKKVSLITDMYLSGTIMSRLLDHAGITQYDELFVSCDYRSLKQEGLFQIYKNAMPGDNYLHIGDNMLSDVESAVKNGIMAVHISKGSSMLEKTAMGEELKLSSLTDRLLAGELIAGVFNNPFNGVMSDGRCNIDNMAVGVRVFIAPLVLSFMNWFVGKIKEGGYNKVLLAARDGYLIDRLYSIYRNVTPDLPPSIYFLASRQASTLAGLRAERDIEWLSRVEYNGTPRDLLVYRFGLDSQEILPYSKFKYMSITDYVMAHEEKIFKSAQKVRTGYLKYMEECGLRKGDRCAFFDFVSSGTSQYYLQSLLSLDLTGLYFCHSVTQDEKKSLNIEGFYVNDGVEHPDTYFYKNYKFLETIMTAPFPSLAGFTESGKALYATEERSSEQIQYIEQMQEVIINYCEEWITNNWKIPTKDEADRFYRMSDDTYTEFADPVLQVLQLRDDWTKKKYCFVESTKGWMDELDFMNSSNMRTSILNWYDFKPDSTVLEWNSGYGALTGLLCERCCQVVAATEDEYKADLIRCRYQDCHNLTVLTCSLDCSPEEMQDAFREQERIPKKFDYVILNGIYVSDKEKALDFIRTATKYLDKGGKLLVLASNYYGMKYMCGYPRWEPGKENEYLLTKSELESYGASLGFLYSRFYYPLPDYRMAQEIYSDNYLPKGSVRDRVLFYSEQKNMMWESEYDFCDKTIEEGTFTEYCNSYFVEYSREDNLSKVDYVALSTDRGKEHGFATIISGDKVIKKAIYPEGVPYLKASYDNIKELEQRGISVVEHTYNNGMITMPYIDAPKAVDYLYERALVGKGEFLGAFKRFTECILKSSKYDGINLRHGYIDMVPLNSFVIDGEFCFFDQEFSMDNCPAGYIIFRALRYLYLTYPDIDRIVPLDKLKEKYGIEEDWDKYLKMEDDFIYNNRNHAVNETFYQWIANTAVEDCSFDNGIRVSSGYDKVESDGNSSWSWAVAEDSRLVYCNDSEEEVEGKFMCELLPPPGAESQELVISIAGRKDTITVVAPVHFECEISVQPHELYNIFIHVNGELYMPGNGDSREFAYRLVNPVIINNFTVEDRSFGNGIRVLSGYDKVERAGNSSWSWSVAKDSRLVYRNDGEEEVEGKFMCELLPPPGAESQELVISIAGRKDTITVVAPVHFECEISVQPHELYNIFIHVNGELYMPGNGDTRKFAYQLMNPLLIT